jgi:hypothetical protein
MMDHPVTVREIDELLQFLAIFEVTGRSYVKASSGSGEPLEEVCSVPHPEYCDEVVAFFWLAGQPCWSDFDYDPRQAQALLGSEEFIDTCSIDELRTLLTYCVRSERFTDGAWLHLLESGRIVALLRRLAVLREEFGPSA